MKLLSHLIDINDGGMGVDAIKGVYIFSPPSSEMINLGSSDMEYWSVLAHYKYKKKPYTLGFELLLEENEIQSKYNLYACLDEEKKIEPELHCYKTDDSRLIYFDTYTRKKNKKNVEFPGGLVRIGSFHIRVENFEGEVLLTSPPIYVFPNSITEVDYNEMMNDLLCIKDSLILNKNAKVGEKIKENTSIEKIENSLERLKAPFLKINKKKIMNLVPTYEKTAFKKIKKIDLKNYIEKKVFPFKRKFTAKIHRESNDIYENRMIKYSLKMINRTIESYIDNLQNKKNDFKKDINKIIDPFSCGENLSYRDLENKISVLEGEVENSIKLTNRSFINYGGRGKKLSTLNHVENEIELLINIPIFLENTKRDFSNILNENEEEYILTYTLVNDSDDSELIKFKQKDGKLHKNSNFQKITFSSSSFNQIVPVVKAFEKRDSNWISFLVLTDPISVEDTKIINVKKILKIDNSELQEIPQEIQEYVFFELNQRASNKGDLLGKLEKIERYKSVLKVSDYNKTNLQLYQHHLEKCVRLKGIVNDYLKLSFLKNAKEAQLTWKPTQIFSNDDDYNMVWRTLSRLEKDIKYLDHKGKTLPVKKCCDIYEIWCLFKIIQLLTDDLGWKLENFDDVYKNLKKYLSSSGHFNDKEFKAILSHNSFQDENSHFLKLNIYYEQRIYYYDENLEKQHKRPDYKFEILTNTSIKSVFYLDAKYRKYESEKQFSKDIIDTALMKYINTFVNTKDFPKSSFILHSTNENEYRYLGSVPHNSIDKKYYQKTLAEEFPNHKFGSIPFIPTEINSFKLMFKMFMEYHLDLYDICWTCGEVHDVERQVKYTEAGIVKYYFICQKCGEFWVKTHCNICGNKLLKHNFDYHHKKSSWNVSCPKCLGYLKKKGKE